VHYFDFDHLRITLQCSDLIWGIKFCAPSLLLPQFIFSYLQALIHGFLWWWACFWIIFSLKWHLRSSFFLLHSTVIDLQETKDSIDEEDPRPTSSTWKGGLVSSLEEFESRSKGPTTLRFIGLRSTPNWVKHQRENNHKHWGLFFNFVISNLLTFIAFKFCNKNAFHLKCVGSLQ